ncbi:hypothetical protein M8C21_016709, partial [Ambrosia artemisiifolia]
MFMGFEDIEVDDYMKEEFPSPFCTSSVDVMVCPIWAMRAVLDMLFNVVDEDCVAVRLLFKFPFNENVVVDDSVPITIGMMSDQSLWSTRMPKFYFGCSNARNISFQIETVTYPNRYLLIGTSGGLNRQRTRITDVVVVGILNATLVVPKLDQKSFWKDSRLVTYVKDIGLMMGYAAFVNGFWTCVDMTSGRYLWRNLAIVMEYVAGGELFDRICNARRFSEDEARFVFLQLISEVSYCHAMQVCYRDLKLENTLIDGSPAPRLKI